MDNKLNESKLNDANLDVISGGASSTFKIDQSINLERLKEDLALIKSENAEEILARAKAISEVEFSSPPTSLGVKIGDKYYS